MRVLVIAVVIVVLIVLDGVRLASVIRNAKALAARALHPRDFTAVAAAQPLPSASSPSRGRSPASDMIENAVEDTLPSGVSQDSSHLFHGAGH